MTRHAIIAVLTCAAFTAGCGRTIVPDRGAVYAREVIAACFNNDVVADTQGSTRARNVRVRDVGDGDGRWLEVCALDAAAPAVRTGSGQSIAIDDAVLQFRGRKIEVGYAALFAAAVVLAVVVAVLKFYTPQRRSDVDV